MKRFALERLGNLEPSSTYHVKLYRVDEGEVLDSWLRIVTDEEGEILHIDEVWTSQRKWRISVFPKGVVLVGPSEVDETEPELEIEK